MYSTYDMPQKVPYEIPPHHLFKFSALGYVATVCPVLGIWPLSDTYRKNLFFNSLEEKKLTIESTYGLFTSSF